jgi:glucose-1-phosphate adenylyltransferase
MKGVVAMVLAGGQGDRLSVLSEERAKPAVIFGGRYRIIDFALSNCANSEINRVGVLTQYRPRSLNDHIGIGRPWDLDREGGGIHLLQPYLGREVSDWYQGTADAVYQNLYYVEEQKAETILILAGDHVYTMAYDKLVDFHRAHQAEVTVPVTTVPWEDAPRFGTLFLDDDDRVVAFDEKPAEPRSNLISMGIYVFSREALLQALVEDAARADSRHDFGGDVLPRLVADPVRQVYAHRFEGYWRDVGTIQSYFDANMDLLEDLPDLNLYDPALRIRTERAPYPSVKVGPDARATRSLLSVGCIINGTVEHSVLSPGVYVEKGATVRDSIIFDDTRVEAGAVIERSIVDKEVLVGANARVGAGDDMTPNQERPDIVHSGISVIGKRAVVTRSLTIGRNCVIGPGVTAYGTADGSIPSGATLRGERRATPFTV